MPIAAVVGAREAVQREQDLLAAGERRRLARREVVEIERREGRRAPACGAAIDGDLVRNRAGEAGQRRLRIGADEERAPRRARAAARISAALRPEKFGPAMNSRIQRSPTRRSRPARPSAIQPRSAAVKRGAASRRAAPSSRASVSLDRPLVARAADRDRHHGEPDRLHQDPAVAQVAPRTSARDDAGRDQRRAGAVDRVQDRLDQRQREHDELLREPAAAVSARDEAERRPSGKVQERRPGSAKR